MGNVISDLTELSSKCFDMREKILTDGLLADATVEQKELCYRTLSNLLKRTNAYITEFARSAHVLGLDDFLKHTSEIYSNKDVSFDLNEMLEKFEKLYKEDSEENNFIAAAYTLILFPLRVIIEKMYRDLLNQTYDEKFNQFFEEK